MNMINSLTLSQIQVGNTEDITSEHIEIIKTIRNDTKQANFTAITIFRLKPNHFPIKGTKQLTSQP